MSNKKSGILLFIMALVFTGLGGFLSVQKVGIKEAVEWVNIKAEPDEDVTLVRDVTYMPSAQERCKLDLAYQADGKAKPLILFVHGGSWYEGDKEDMEQYIYTFSEKGYVCASMDYDHVMLEKLIRTDENKKIKVTIKKQVKMVITALEFLTEHADEYEIDTDAVYLFGFSAGGQLAGNAAEIIRKYDKDLFHNYRLNGVILQSGAVDLKTILYENMDQTEGNMLILLPEIFAGNRESDVITELSYVDVLSNITKKLPPVLLIHGKSDQKVPYICSQNVYDALQAKGVEAELDLVDGEPHSINRNIVCTKINQFLTRQENRRLDKAKE